MIKAVALLLCLVPFSSHAQAPLSTGPSAHADGVTTQRQVFRHERRHARLGAAAAGLVLGAQAISFATDRSSSSATRLTLGVSVSALYTYFLVDRVVGWGQFSRHREEKALRRLEAHQPQSHYVQHRWALAAEK